MKFATLALALLLAVACQAAPADISALDHARSVVNMALTNMKESTKKALKNLDATVYEEQGKRLVQQLDDAHLQLQNYQAQVAPNTNQMYETAVAATEPLRMEIAAEIEKLKADIEPKGQHLKDVVVKHLEEYRSLLEPIMLDHQVRHAAEMEALKIRLEPVMAQLQNRMQSNIEETKGALMPIIDSVGGVISERVSQLHQASKPYIDEYRTKVEEAMKKAQNIDPNTLAELKARVEMKGEMVKIALTQYFGELMSALELF